MKDYVLQSLASHLQPTPLLHHVTLNTGHVALHELNGIHSLSACDFLPLLEQRGGEIPEMPGFAFALSEATHCCQFVLTYHGSELITGGVAWGPDPGDSLWRWLGDCYGYHAPRVPGWWTACPPTPPAPPWLGVVLSLNLGLIPAKQVRQLAAVERDVALALIQRSLTRN
jgi:hypothetical protein